MEGPQLAQLSDSVGATSSEFCEEVTYAKKEAIVINTGLGIITLGKIISTSICLSYARTAFSPMLLWLYMMQFYDCVYFIHLLLASHSLIMCSEEELLYEYDLPQTSREEQNDTNLQSFMLQQIMQSSRPINGFRILENAEKRSILAFKSGEFCRLWYFIIFVYGNVLFYADIFIETPTNFPLAQLTKIFICFGFIYLSIPIVLCATWPFLAIYLQCSTWFGRGNIFNYNQVQPPATSECLKNLKVVQFEDLTLAKITVEENSNKVQQDRETDCSICFEQYKSRENLVVMPCNSLHIFHENCVKKWLNVHATCPICRYSVIEMMEMKNTHKKVNLSTQP